MKKIITLILIIIITACSGSTENKKKKDLSALILTGTYGTGFVQLSWEYPTDIGNFENVYVEQSTDGGVTFEEVDSFFDRRQTTTLTGLTNEVSHQFRVYYNIGKRNSLYSDIVTLTPTTGQPLIEEAWGHIDIDPQASYDKFNQVVDLGLSAQLNAKVGRGWALLKLIDGDKTQTTNIAAVKSDFIAAINKKDANAGSVIISMLEGNFSSVVNFYIKVQSNYQHEYLSYIDTDYMHLHGAIGYWFLNDHDRVNEILDLLDPTNAPYELGKDAQFDRLTELMDGAHRPKK